MKSKIAAALFLFALTVALRISSGAGLFFKEVDPGTRIFEIFDSTYQMRRVDMIVKKYPTIPYFDSYHYYPDIPPVPWPPGYNLFLATMAKPFDMMGASRLFRETLVGLMPCVLEGIAILFFFIYFSQNMSFKSAFLASLLISLSTINITFSEVGYIDHHYFITFLIALNCLMMARFQKNPSKKNALWLGGVLGCGPFFNVSLIQFIGLFLLAISITVWIDKKKESNRWSLLYVYAGALTTAFLSAFTTPVGRQFKFVYDQTSLFQFGLILLLASVVFLTFLWSVPLLKEKSKRYGITAMIIFVIGSLTLVTIPQVKEGARFLLAGNLLNYVQGEEQSILKYFPLWKSILMFWILFFPFGLYVLFKRLNLKTFFVVHVSLLLVYGLLTGLSHFLYLQYLFPWYAVTIALGVQFVMEKLKKPMGGLQFLILFPFLIQMGSAVYGQAIKKSTDEIQARDSIAQTIRAFAWMRETTPKTSFHEFGDGKPEYSVWAFRDHGHQLARIAERPAVVSPFSTPDFVDHMIDYSRYTFTKSEDIVYSLLARYNSRYVLLDHRNYSLKDFYINLLKGQPGSIDLIKNANDLPFIFCNNLLFFDGELRWRRTPGVKHFRLVYEVSKKVKVPLKSKKGSFAHQFNGLKIFERVKGATIHASGFQKGDRIMVSLPLVTNTGRVWTYTNYSEADHRGKVSMTVPYPSHQLSISAVKPTAHQYSLLNGNKLIKKFSITEDQVQYGDQIML